VAGFCEQEGVSTASFYAWRKRLRGTRKVGKDGRPVFASVRLTPAGTPMSIHLPGGVRVEVPMENLDAVRAVVGEVLALAGVPEGAHGPNGADGPHGAGRPC
jgi:hypothetical protein